MKPSAPIPAARRLAVSHATRYRYDTPVEVAHHSAHLRPRDTDRQRCLRWALRIDPPPDGAVQESLDAFGNWRHGFNHAANHQRLEVVSTAEVLVDAVPELRHSASPAWPTAVDSLRYRAGLQQPEATGFSLGSGFAPVHPALRAFIAPLLQPDRPVLELAWALMLEVHRRMAYRPHSTDVATDAVTALAQGQGVCQDFAHLMIGAWRSAGLAARYVSGYLLTEPPPGQPRLQGADASHAWVAVWCPENGWVALDPTNAMAVGQDHVTVAWGRDYADVAPLRGVIRGGGRVPPEVAVTVSPLV